MLDMLGNVCQKFLSQMFLLSDLRLYLIKLKNYLALIIVITK